MTLSRPRLVLIPGDAPIEASLIEPLEEAFEIIRLDDPGQLERVLAELSPQERKILSRIADGKTNREIAGEMYLAQKTVKNYVSNLLRKLQMNNRAEAAAYAARLEALRESDGDSQSSD